MPRKRFSELDRIYETLKQAKVDIQTLPRNLDITKYAEWKEGEGPERTIVRPDLGDSVDVGIVAFGLPSTAAAAKIQIGWNERAQTFFENLTDKALFGIEATTLTDYNENPIPLQLSKYTPRTLKPPIIGDGEVDIMSKCLPVLSLPVGLQRPWLTGESSI